MSGSGTTHEVETLDLSGFSTVCKDIIRTAIQLGWIGRPVKGGQGIMLISPVDSSQTLTIPGNNTNFRKSRYDSAMRKVVRYADPVHKAVATASIQEFEKGRKGITTTEDSPMYSGDTVPAHYDPRPDKPVPRLVTTSGDPAPPDPEPVEPEPDVFVVSENPWLARSGTSDRNAYVYESGAVVERKWSDGSKDYKCSACDFTDPAPHRIAHHYRRSSKESHPALERHPETMRAEPYVPQSRSVSAAQRAEKLAKELAKATEAIGLPPQEGTDEWLLSLAREVINKRDERRDAEGEHEPVPLTPDQIIERIRGLVDDGSYLRRLERERELEARLALIETQAEECKLRAEEAENERDHIRSEWQAVIQVLQQSPYAGGVQGEGP